MVVTSRPTGLRAASIASALALLVALAGAGATVGSSTAPAIADPAPALAVVPVVADGAFDALPDHGPVGAVVGVFPFSNCPAPTGAGDWVVQLRFAQGANSAISFQDFVLSSAGGWGGNFTIPIGAQPGAAAITAECFDAAHATQATFTYADVPFTVESSTFAALPTSAPVGGTIAVHDVGPCPAPAGASSWTVVVHVDQGATAAISSQNYVVDGAGHWGGHLVLPYGVVPGPAQLSATCFDATHIPAVTLVYAAVPITITIPTITVRPASDAPGSVITISGDSPCPAAPGASSWTALVDFAQGQNDAVSYRNYVVGPAGTWGGTFTVPAGAVAGPAQLVATCFDAAHSSVFQLSYLAAPFSVTLDTTPPVLHLPATRTVNATGRGGAKVGFLVTATDTQDPAPRVACRPASRSTFRIGTTTVACTAIDLAGNSVGGHFAVKVLGAGSQLSNLVARVAADHLRASLSRTLVTDLTTARSALAARSKARACTALTAFARAVRSATGHGITSAQAAVLTAADTRIRAVAGC